MRFFATLTAALVLAAPAFAVDQDHYKKARGMIDKSISWLRAQQDKESGGWCINPAPNAPQYPAITGLVLNGLLMEPGINHEDPTVAKGLRFILSFRQPDGGIYDRILPSYNTSICLSSLSRLHTPEAIDAIKPAQDFLKKLQWGEDSLDDKDKDTGKVTKEHPFYGGMGYGKTGRPDNSNLTLMLQALHDSGVSCDDAAFQRAVVFLSRTQMLGTTNDMEFAKGSTQGGFIYSTSPDKDHIGQGESKGPNIEETLSDGTKASRLRAYGSMTYAGFKSYIFANLKRDDERVKAAYDWIRRNYTMKENPGVGADGQYYYYITLARSLDAWGAPRIDTLKEDGSAGESHDWAADLIDQLATLQNEDGSFKSVDNRWMEDNQVLITAYALIALQHAVD